MNIAEILKDCPKGTKLYSPIFGEVELIEVNSQEILVQTYNLDNVYFDIEGRFNIGYDNTECLLFPSKENRDWSTFKIPKKEYEFKPFDKVLVRDSNDDVWNINFFSFIATISKFKYQTITFAYEQCIPYEGNEHLLGTTNNPD